MANGLITASEFSAIEGECLRWESEVNAGTIFVGSGVHRGQSLTHASMETLYQSIYNIIDSELFKKYEPQFVYEKNYSGTKPMWADRNYLIGEPQYNEKVGVYDLGIFTYIQNVCQNCPSDGICSHGCSCDGGEYGCICDGGRNSCYHSCAICYGSEWVCFQHECGAHLCGSYTCTCDGSHFCGGYGGCVSDCTGWSMCNDHHCFCHGADSPVCSSDSGC